MIYLEEEFREPVKYQLSKEGYDKASARYVNDLIHIIENNSKFLDKLRYKKILKQNQARTQTGRKWAKYQTRTDTALTPLKLRGWNKNV